MSLIATATTLDRATGLRHLYAATDVVGAILFPTPQYCRPLLSQVMDTTVWMKYENHTEVGAFKVRNGPTYLHMLRQHVPQARGMITATRDSHGQPITLAACRDGLAITIVVSHDSSVRKNAAMRVLGAELPEAGEDFQASRELADRLATERDLRFVPSYHDGLVAGVASYQLEFFEATPLDVVYVLIGMGSGIRATVRARNALTLSARIMGAVSVHVRCYEQSLKNGTVMSAPVPALLADGLACRAPDMNALEAIRAGIDEVITVTGDETAQAIRLYFSTTHNVVEGAATAALTGAWQQRGQIADQRTGLLLTSGNIGHATLARVLAGQPILPQVDCW